MRILFFTHYFPPEVNAPANRTFEHAREWVRLGHEVHVVTCVPSHPRGVVYPGYRMRWRQQEHMDGIHVHRVWTLLAPNSGTIRRTLNYLSFVPCAAWRSLRLGRFDVMVATSPQFFCAVTGWLAGLCKRTPWVFEVRDLWPESIRAVGAVRASVALRLLEHLELAMYRSARHVVCVTKAFIEDLAGRGVPREKLTYVPNGIDAGVWEADGERVRWRTRLGLGSQDVLASYIGTVGMAHGIGTLLKAARELEAQAPAVRFVVVGDGAERDALSREVENKGPRNVSFLGQVSRDEVPGLMAASDISLVMLRDSPLFRTVLPSKLFEAMAAANPVVLGVEGEARRVLEESGGGVCHSPEDAEALAACVRRLAADQADRMRLGACGRAYVRREFDRTTWARRLLVVLRNVVLSTRVASRVK